MSRRAVPVVPCPAPSRAASCCVASSRAVPCRSEPISARVCGCGCDTWRRRCVRTLVRSCGRGRCGAAARPSRLSPAVTEVARPSVGAPRPDSWDLRTLHICETDRYQRGSRGRCGAGIAYGVAWSSSLLCELQVCCIACNRPDCRTYVGLGVGTLYPLVDRFSLPSCRVVPC